MKEGTIIGLAVVLAGLVGYVANDWRHAEQAKATPADATIKLPAEVAVAPGEMAELRAETNGNRVAWTALDSGLAIRELDPRSVLIVGAKPGNYRVMCWTAVGGTPTPPTYTTVKVSEKTERKTETASR